MGILARLCYGCDRAGNGFAVDFVNPFLVKWGVIGILLLAAFASGWMKGNVHGGQKLIDYKVKQAQEATRITQARTKVTERVVTKYIKVAGATETITKEIEKEVKVYADANPGNMCIDATWLRLHDAAAINAVPKPAGTPVGPLQTTAADYRHAHSLTGIGYGSEELRGASPLR